MNAGAELSAIIQPVIDEWMEGPHNGVIWTKELTDLIVEALTIKNVAALYNAGFEAGRRGGWSGLGDDPSMHDVPVGDGDRKEGSAGSVTGTLGPDAPVAHHHDGWFCCREQVANMAWRVLAGECTVGPRPSDGKSWCYTHVVLADYGHHLSVEARA